MHPTRLPSRWAIAATWLLYLAIATHLGKCGYVFQSAKRQKKHPPRKHWVVFCPSTDHKHPQFDILRRMFQSPKHINTLPRMLSTTQQDRNIRQYNNKLSRMSLPSTEVIIRRDVNTPPKKWAIQIGSQQKSQVWLTSPQSNNTRPWQEEAQRSPDARTSLRSSEPRHPHMFNVLFVEKT